MELVMKWIHPAEWAHETDSKIPIAFQWDLLNDTDVPNTKEC